MTIIDAIIYSTEQMPAWFLQVSVHIGQQTSTPRLYLSNNELSVVSHTRDLGVVVCDGLSPTMHFNDIVSKVHRCAMLISRTFVPRDVAFAMFVHL